MDNPIPGNSFPEYPADRPEYSRFDSPPGGGKPGNPPEKKKGFLWPVLSLIGLVILKFKNLLIFLKFAKFGFTAITMAATVWAYAIFYGWAFAAGLVALIFLHEMGHALAMRMRGVSAGAPVFIPFVGAYIALKDRPQDVKVESFIAYGGPLAGAIASTFCYSLFKDLGNPLFLVLAYVGFMMNLFNLIPFSPLDGGRIVAAVSTKIWGAGLVAVLVFFFRTHNPILLMILVFGGLQLWESRKKKEEEKEYYSVEPSYRLAMGLSYLGIVLYLGYMTILTLNMLNQDGIRGGLNI